MKYLLLLCLCSTAHAQCTTLQYTGAPFTTLAASSNEPMGADIPVYSPITGSLTLTAPLAATANQSVVPTAWAFTAPWFNINNGLESTLSVPIFNFTTVNGAITEWSISYSYNGPGGSEGSSIQFSYTLSSTGDSVDLSTRFVCASLQCITGTTTFSLSGSSALAGTWGCTAMAPVAPAKASTVPLYHFRGLQGRF